MTIHIRLVTCSYPEKAGQRQRELRKCLEQNLSCMRLSEILLLVEGGEPHEQPHTKVKVKPIAHRPTFQDYLDWIGELESNQDVSVIANSDIYFDESIAVMAAALQPGQCVALARWDVQPC